MGSNLLFVGIDVDDKSFKGAALQVGGEEFMHFVTAPSSTYLVPLL